MSAPRVFLTGENLEFDGQDITYGGSPLFPEVILSENAKAPRDINPPYYIVCGLRDLLPGTKRKKKKLRSGAEVEDETWSFRANVYDYEGSGNSERVVKSLDGLAY
ncbi:hypothetical protein HK102_005893, partial [Quaeritorhiza haematococci]